MRTRPRQAGGMKRFLPALVFLCGAALPLAGKVVTQTVVYHEGGAELRGFLAYDDAAAGARPGVLVVPEWWGLTAFAKNQAVRLAELGYAAFAADMYGDGVTTDDPKKAGELAGPFYAAGGARMAQRAQAGLDAFLQTGRADPARMAAIGFCFGGATVQELAYSGAALRGVVSFHGGLELPPADTAGVKARLLILQGAKDPFTSQERITKYIAAMNRTALDWRLEFFAGAKHSFMNPQAAGYHLDGASYDPVVAARAWAAMQAFLDAVFGGPPPRA